MKKVIIILYLYLLSVSSFGINFSQDFILFKNIFYSTHPNLYQYHDHEFIDSIFSETAQKITEIKTEQEYFILVQSIISTIKDGHTQIYSSYLLPKGNNTASFPFLIKIIENQLIVDYSSLKEISIGTKILSINGEKVESILSRLEKYVVVDGYGGIKRKARILEKKFHYYYCLEYGEHKNFAIEYEVNKLLLATNIKAKTLYWHLDKDRKRSSYFSNYRKHNQVKPSVKFIDSLNTAVLTINTFNRDLTLYYQEIDQIFIKIIAKETKNLVIDLRRNTGGYRKASIYLFSYLTSKNFKQRNQSALKNTTLPYPQYLIQTSYDESVMKKNVCSENKFIDVLEEYMLIHENSFKGKIYLLTSGQTFSAASSFASLAYNHDITLIGEETSGGYHHYSSDFFAMYQLPHTKIYVSFFLTQVTANVNYKNIPHGSGVKPHHEVEISIDDLILNRDTQLHFTLNKINKNREVTDIVYIKK